MSSSIVIFVPLCGLFSISSKLDNFSNLKVYFLPRSIGNSRIEQEHWHLEEIYHVERKHIFRIKDWIAPIRNSLDEVHDSVRQAYVLVHLLISVVVWVKKNKDLIESCVGCSLCCGLDLLVPVVTSDDVSQVLVCMKQ